MAFFRTVKSPRSVPERLTRLLALAVLVSAVNLTVTSAKSQAETLLDAITRTYRENSSLSAAREGALAAGENVPRAKAGYLPRLIANGEAGYRKTWSGNATDSSGTSYNASLQARQTVFDGFRTRNAVAQAEVRSKGAEESLRNSEHGILLAAVKAYVDTYASRALERSSARYRASLQKQLELVRSLHALGDAVASDVAEVEARLAEADAELSRAQAAAEQSAAEYERIVGVPAGTLEAPPPLDALLPPSRQKAVALALAQHPAILAAHHAAADSEYEISVVESEFAPHVDVVGSASTARSAGSSENKAGIFAQLSIPIFSGGEIMARSRQAKHIASQRQLEARAAVERVNADVHIAWSSMTDARLRTKAARTHVKAAATALEGLRIGYKVGERSNFEVLDGEREVYDAATAQIIADRDFVVATYAVSEASGQLSFAAVSEALRRRPKSRPWAAATAKPVQAKMQTKLRRRMKVEPTADVPECDSCNSLPQAGMRPSIAD